MEKEIYSMNEELKGSAAGLWLAVISISMGLGLAGGYFVVAHQAESVIKQREEGWRAHFQTLTSQDDKRKAEMASLKSVLSAKDQELSDHRKKEAELTRELREAHKTLVAERKQREAEMEEIMPILNKDWPAVDATRANFEKAKQGFTSLKAELDTGKYKGLESSDGFQILSAAFETVPEKK